MSNLYKQTYDFLLAQSPPDIKAMILKAVNNDSYYPPVVREFVKRVILLAEQGS
jgi:hypothetical protein